MSYKKAAELLPLPLLLAIQKFVDGEYLYIPRKEENRKAWGEAGPGRKNLDERNRRIIHRYETGTPVRTLAEDHFLSEKTIYKILAARKRINLHDWHG